MKKCSALQANPYNAGIVVAGCLCRWRNVCVSRNFSKPFLRYFAHYCLQNTPKRFREIVGNSNMTSVMIIISLPTIVGRISSRIFVRGGGIIVHFVKHVSAPIKIQYNEQNCNNAKIKYGYILFWVDEITRDCFSHVKL